MERSEGRHGRRCRVVVVGRANSGRCTTIDFLMAHSGAGWVPSRTLMDSLFSSGLPSSSLNPHLTSLEQLKAELERGEPVPTTTPSGRGPAEKFAIVDVSGHKDFVKNLVVGTTQADLVLLFVSAAPGEFEAGLAETKALLELCQMLGVARVVVAVNKMDTVGWSQERFESIQHELRALLSGPISAVVQFVPVSGLHGANVASTPDGDDLGWWSGPTLLQALDAPGPLGQSLSIYKPLRVPVRPTTQEIFRIGGGVGSVVMGRVASGVVRAGVLVSFAHCGLTSSIKALEVISGGRLEHVEGDHTGFSLTTQPTTMIARGDVCGDTHSDPPRACASFTALLALLGREGLEIRPGDTVRLRCHFAVVECRVARLVAQVSRRTGAYAEAAPARLRGADVADVELEPLEPLCVEAFADYGHALGRFVVEVADQVAAVGLVKTVTKEEEEHEEEGEEGEEDSV